MVKIKYNCYNCNTFCEDTLSKIINHIDNDTCEKSAKYCLLSNDIILVMSIIPYVKNHPIELINLMHLLNSTFLYNNKNKIFDLLKSINNGKYVEEYGLTCVCCNLNFGNIVTELYNHILTSKCIINILKNNLI